MEKKYKIKNIRELNLIYFGTRFIPYAKKSIIMTSFLLIIITILNNYFQLNMLFSIYALTLVNTSRNFILYQINISQAYFRPFFTQTLCSTGKNPNLTFQNELKNIKNYALFCIFPLLLQVHQISVVIPTLNEERYIRECLMSLRNQNFKDYEIILVDGGSKDKTVEYAKPLVDKTLIAPNTPVGASRNIGAKIAKGHILAFIDADTIASKNWLKSIQEAFNSPSKPVGVTGPTLPSEGRKLDHLIYKISTGWIQKISLSMGIPHVAGFNCAYLKDPFLRCGGFDNDKNLSEDLVLSHKIRHEGRIVFSKEMLAYTSLRRIRYYGYIYLASFYLMNDLLFLLTNKTLDYKPIR